MIQFVAITQRETWCYNLNYPITRKEGERIYLMFLVDLQKSGACTSLHMENQQLQNEEVNRK
jgi:hypothetical protein